MVYKNEYSTRRVYTSSSPSPTVASSFSYTVSPISRRRKPVVTTRVFRIPYAVNTPLSDQQILNLITLGNGRAGSVPRVAVQKLAGITAPPRSSLRLNEMYSELEDEVRGSSHLGTPFRRSVTPIRGTTPLRSLSPARSMTPGPIRSITYHQNPTEPSYQLAPLQELQAQSLMRSRTDDILLHLALGLNPPLYSLHHIPLRSALDVKEACDVRRQFVHERNMYDPLSRGQSEIYRLAFNRRPRKVEAGYIAGNGTLACLSYAGGRPIAKRRRFYPDEENKPVEDLKFNNYYKPSAVGSYYSTAGRKPAYQPIYRSKKSLLGLPDTPDSYRKEAESKWERKGSLGRRSSPPPRTSPPKRIISTSAVTKPIQASNLDNISVTLPRPRKSVSDLPEDFVPPPSPTQQLPVPDASVVFKIPRKSVSQEPQESPLQKDDEDEIIEVVKIKRPSLKPTPSPEPEVQPEYVNEHKQESKPEASEPEPPLETEQEVQSEPQPEAETETFSKPEDEPEQFLQEPSTGDQLEEAEPEPTVSEPEPTVSEPEPTVSEPEPSVSEPEPSVSEPEPTVSEPEPTVSEPEPIMPEPITESEPQTELETVAQAELGQEEIELVEQVPEADTNKPEASDEPAAPLRNQSQEPESSSIQEEGGCQGDNIEEIGDNENTEKVTAAEETADATAENEGSDAQVAENVSVEHNENLDKVDSESPIDGQNEASASEVNAETEDTEANEGNMAE